MADRAPRPGPGVEPPELRIGVLVDQPALRRDRRFEPLELAGDGRIHRLDHDARLLRRGAVVEIDERLAVHERNALRYLESDQQRAYQSGSLRDRDGIEIRVLEPRIGHGLAHHRADVLDVVARRQLRDHPAKRGMDCRLGRHDVREDVPAVFDHRGRGFVAGRLDREQPHAGQAGEARARSVSV